MLLHFEANDYDAWKRMFDEDPAGRKQAATGHTISRSVDNPNAVFVRTDFASADEAKSFRQHLLDSGVLDNPNITVKVPPTIVEQAEEVAY